MRDIKFRVFDGEKIISLNEAEELGLVCIQAFTSSNEGMLEPCYNHVKILQSTGLFDKNGVEIYENYVLQIENIGIVCVVFDKYSAGFMLRHKTEVDKLGVFKQYCFCEIELSETEIIGYSAGELNSFKEGFEPSVWSEACHENDVYLAHLTTADAKT